jgi:hypothetical protein
MQITSAFTIQITSGFTIQITSAFCCNELVSATCQVLHHL